MAVERTDILIKTINEASAELIKIRKDLAGIGDGATAANGNLEKLRKGLSSLGRELAGIGAALSVGVTTPLVLLGKTMLDQVGSIEQYKVAFDTMLGSAEEGSRVLKEVSDFAAKTPFDLPGVVGASKQLLALGIETDKLLPTLKSIGDVAAGTGAPLERLILNFGQVATQGKLTGRELRDFAVNGVPLIDELAKNLGVAKDEIQDLVSAGEVGFADVEEAFRTMTSEGGRFFDLMDRQSGTLQGIISNLRDNFIRVSLALLGISNDASNFGEIIEGGVFDRLKDIAEGLLEQLDNLVTFFNSLSIETRTTIVAVAALAAALGPIILLLGAFVASLGVLLSPIGAVIAAIAALGAAAIIFRDKIKSVIESDFVQGLIGIFRGLFAIVSTIIGAIREMVGAVQSLIERFPILGSILKVIAGIFLVIQAPIIVVVALLKEFIEFIGAIGNKIADFLGLQNELVLNADKSVEAAQKSLSIATTLSNDLQGVDEEYYAYKEELARRDLAVQEANAELQRVISERSLADRIGNLTEEQAQAEKTAQEKFDLAVKEQNQFLDNTVEKRREITNLNKFLTRGAEEVAAEQIKLDKEATNEKIKLLKKYEIADEKNQKALLQQDLTTVQAKLKNLQDLGISDENIKNAILQNSEDLSKEEIETAVEKYNGIGQAAETFRNRLGTLLNNPLVQTIKVAVEDASGLIPGLQNVIETQASRFKNALTSTFAKISVATSISDDEIGGNIADAITGGGGGGGGAVDKAAEEVEQRIEELNNSIQEFGRISITEGGRVVDRFEDIEGAIDGVKDRILELEDRQAELLNNLEFTADDISRILEEGLATDNVISDYADLEDAVANVISTVEDLKAEQQAFIDDAQAGLDTFEESLDSINEKYNELIETTSNRSGQDFARSLSTALDKQADITERLQQAIEAKNDLEADASDKQRENAQKRIDELQEELNAIDDTVSSFQEFANGNQDFTDQITEATTKVEGLEAKYQELIAAGQNAADVEKQLQEAREEQFLLIGKQQLAEEEIANIKDQIAEDEAKRNLSELDFIAFKLGKELEAIEEKRQAELQTAEQIRQIQQSIVDGDIDALAGTIGGQSIEDLQGEGFTQEAIDFAQNAIEERARFETALAEQLDLLNNYKEDEKALYEDTRQELEDQQQILEDFMINSYDNIISKLQAVQQAAIAAFQAQQRVAGGGGGGAGFAKGGFTGNGPANQIAGIVHKGEWVAPKWMVQNFRPMIDFLEGVRNNRAKGFAQGGFTSPQTSEVNNFTINAPSNQQPDLRASMRELAWIYRTSK